ncbi:MAG: PEP-CTERM sorting domain-containing protein [Verrucomicrobiota bacterium]
MKTSQSVRVRSMGIISSLAFFSGMTSLLSGQSINVPNGSFESQSGAGQPFGVNINIDSWQKADRPAYFPESGYNGFFWVQTAGVFVDTNPYGNRVGAQAGYLLPFPGAGISQDLSSPDAKFQVGMSYNFTLGLFAKAATNGILQLSFYYRDGLNNMVPVGVPTTITYSEAAFPITPSLNFVDYSVATPTVLSGDAWAGQNIGLKIDSVYGEGTGNWDFDNARLTAVPEPVSIALLALGAGGILITRMGRRFRK